MNTNWKKEKMGALCKLILLELFNATLQVGSFMENRRDPLVFKEHLKYERWKNKKRDEYWQKIYNLESHGYLKRIKTSTNESRIELTAHGLMKALKFKFDPEFDQIPKRWDREWRLIIFDVTENFRNRRDIFRYMLLSWGFEPIQKSVFVYPHECRKEINLAKAALNLKDLSIQYIVAREIETENELIKKFKEKKILV